MMSGIFSREVLTYISTLSYLPVLKSNSDTLGCSAVIRPTLHYINVQCYDLLVGSRACQANHITQLIASDAAEIFLRLHVCLTQTERTGQTMTCNLRITICFGAAEEPKAYPRGLHRSFFPRQTLGRGCNLQYAPRNLVLVPHNERE